MPPTIIRTGRQVESILILVKNVSADDLYIIYRVIFFFYPTKFDFGVLLFIIKSCNDYLFRTFSNPYPQIFLKCIKIYENSVVTNSKKSATSC